MIARSRLVAAILSGLCILAAALPITTIVDAGRWVPEVLALVALVVAVGSLARAIRAPLGAVPLIQFVCLLAVLGLLYGLFHLDPAKTVDDVRELVSQAGETVRKYAAPAPATTGLSLVLAFAIPTLAIATEHLAVNYRMPALAGVPLLTTFLLSTSNTGHGLPIHYFVILAALWLVLVAHDDASAIRRWTNSTAHPTTPTRLDDRLGIGSHASAARLLGVSALIAALIVPAFLPHAAPVFLTEGLGRAPGPGNSVSFNSTADLARDLRNRSQAPVLQFSTRDPNPPPLKVLVAGTYSNGEWTAPPPPRDLQPGNGSLRLSSQPALLRSAATTMTVQDNNLAAPQVALPDNPLLAQFGPVDWSFDAANTQIYTDSKAANYAVDYVPDPATLTPSSTEIPATLFPEDREIPPAAKAELIRTLALIKPHGTPFEQATQIQNWLRQTGDFTYSLTLAPTRQGPNGAPLDPLSNFLVTKQGYCTQFATAMIMMARQQGIPARLAMGFLPGTSIGADTYQVVQADAHAWPELWFPGIGWTRFDPTPAVRSGLAPLYAAPDQNVPGRTAAPTRESVTSAPSASSAPAATPSGGGLPVLAILRGIGIAILAVGIIALVVGLLPSAAHSRRRRRLAGSSTSNQRIEAEWANLVDRLEDYGVPGAPTRSPRGQRTHYTRAVVLDDAARQALGRATATLEDARYGRPDSMPNASLEQDGRILLETIRRSQSARQRIGARVVPLSGRRQIRDWLRLRG